MRAIRLGTPEAHKQAEELHEKAAHHYDAYGTRDHRHIAEEHAQAGISHAFMHSSDPKVLELASGDETTEYPILERVTDACASIRRAHHAMAEDVED